MEVVSRAEIQALDREAGEKFLIDETILMENAGLAAVGVLAKELGQLKGRNFVICCGTGNNGGDGLVVARQLWSQEARVTLVLLGNPERFTGGARKNWQIVQALSLPVISLKESGEAAAAVAAADVVVDALFGTGLTRPVHDLAALIIRAINAGGKKVLSLDIPSGVDGDTGEILGVAVQADWTVTFGRPKRGNVLYPGYQCTGRLYLAPISFPPELVTRCNPQVALNNEVYLPPPDPEAHKGSRGQCLVIAGARSYCGAPLFCALSFLRTGGGYVRLALPSSLVPALAAAGREIVFLPQEETPAGSLALACRDALIDLAARMDVVIIGPGLSLAPETGQLVRDLAVAIERPLIIDGDGLTALANDISCLTQRKAPTLLTPHLGEMSRLVGRPHQEWWADRIGLLQRCAASWQATIVLKGPHSLIAHPEGRVYVNMSGNPGMATPGAGDVLPGIMAALHGAGLDWEKAAPGGVFLHGLAGDLAAQIQGEEGLLARDILDHVPAAIKINRQGLPPELERRYRPAGAL
jgi:NAD(P)H-hydrate epimerase